MTATVVLQHNRDAAEAIIRRQPFENRSGTFTGGYILDDSYTSEHGRLTGEDMWHYWDAIATGTYVIWSYDTPIAWFRNDRQVWVIPNVFYTVTTSKHQSVVRHSVPQEI